MASTATETTVHPIYLLERVAGLVPELSKVERGKCLEYTRAYCTVFFDGNMPDYIVSELAELEEECRTL